MSSRNSFAAILMACLLGVGLLGVAPVANAASAGQSLVNPGKSATNNVIEITRRGHNHSPWVVLPIAPSYQAYDYPYYYSRGYYPTHIGPGYIYYGYPYDVTRGYYTTSGGRCSKWHRRCGAKWGSGNEDYYGCMDDHGCE
jgi:hypothetical protein